MKKGQIKLCQSYRNIVSNPLTCQLSFAAGFLSTNREHQNLPGNLGQQSAIYWNSLGLFRDNGLNHIFF